MPRPSSPSGKRRGPSASRHPREPVVEAEDEPGTGDEGGWGRPAGIPGISCDLDAFRIQEILGTVDRVLAARGLAAGADDHNDDGDGDGDHDDDGNGEDDSDDDGVDGHTEFDELTLDHSRRGRRGARVGARSDQGSGVALGGGACRGVPWDARSYGAAVRGTGRGGDAGARHGSNVGGGVTAPEPIVSVLLSLLSLLRPSDVTGE